MNPKNRKAMFANQGDVNSWILKKSKEYGNKSKFTSSDEYREAYPTLMKVYNDELKNHGNQGQIAMKDVGHNFGDRLHYSQASPFGDIKKYNGVLIKDKNGVPFVRLDNGKKTKWHKGFFKE